jgi:hypothetical protein
MARIRTYGTDSVIQDTDILLGSDSLYQFETANFAVGAIKTHVLTSVALSYVPYTGATGSINIGANDIYTLGGARLGDDGTVWGTSFTFANFYSSLQDTSSSQNSWLLPDQSGTIALLSDIAAANTLNDVLTNGNISQIDAKVGGLFMYNDFAPTFNGYVSITGSKNRFNFYNNVGTLYAHISQDAIFLDDFGSVYGMQIKKPASLTAVRTATFQDADGIVAYLSDIPPGPITTPTLNDVLTAGNTSVLNANVGGSLGIYDAVGSDYAYLNVADAWFTFRDWENNIVISFEQEIFSIHKTNAISGTFATGLLTASHSYSLPNASGTIALTADIPAAQVQSNWTETNTASKAFILNKPSIATVPVDTTYLVQGGTSGIQPTFNGQPLFTSSYVQTGDLVFFRINVDMSNITSFGTGQYYVTLPFDSKYDMIVSSGHLQDNSANDNYQLSGEITAGSNVMWLYYIASNSQLAAFDHNSPKVLDLNDFFHISGTYIKE